MKYYDNNAKRNHIVRVTLQNMEYKGYIAYEVRGTVLGLDVLKFEAYEWDEEDVSNFTINDCEFKVDNLDNCFSVRLKNERGDILVLDNLDDCDINDMVVTIEIIHCVEV